MDFTLKGASFSPTQQSYVLKCVMGALSFNIWRTVAQFKADLAGSSLNTAILPVLRNVSVTGECASHKAGEVIVNSQTGEVIPDKKTGKDLVYKTDGWHVTDGFLSIDITANTRLYDIFAVEACKLTLGTDGTATSTTTAPSDTEVEEETTEKTEEVKVEATAEQPKA